MSKDDFVFSHKRAFGHVLFPAEPVDVWLRWRQRRGRRIIGVEHRAVCFRLILENACFGSAICFQRVVPVQVVGCEIQEHADVGAKRFDQLQLKTAQLHNRDSAVAALFHARNQGSADIPGENGGKTGVLQNVFDQGRRRRFPVRAGDPDQASAKKTVRQLHLAPDGDALGARRLQQRRIGGHAGTRNNQVLFEESIFTMATQLQPHARDPEVPNRLGDFVFRQRIRCRHVGAPLGAKERGGHTRPRQSHNQHALAPQLERIRH
jgi:hypothetical protein